MKPTLGRIVIYRMTAADAETVNLRRTTESAVNARMPDNGWPLGAQAHLGNYCRSGDELPAMIVKTWGESAESCCNLQVFLDGTDVFWATSRCQGEQNGMWHFPQRVYPEVPVAGVVS